MLVYIAPYAMRHDYYMSLVPHGLSSIAALCEKKGFDVTLANLSQEGVRRGTDIIERAKPDLLGVSLFSFNRIDSLNLIRAIKKRMPGLTIVAGGPHATFLADEIAHRYPEIDHIIRFEAEDAFMSLLRMISKGELPSRIIDGERVTDLDKLPFPSLFRGELLGVNTNEQYKYIITSRGCPNACTFCSSPSFWKGKVTYRSAENIMSEIEHLYRKQGIIYFSIRDDNFTLNKKRVLKFCRLLSASGIYLMWNCQARVDTIDEEMLTAMKCAGLEHIQYGVESGSQRMLEMYDKHATIEQIERAAGATRKVGVYLSIYLMAGMRDEKGEDIEKTRRLVRRILPGDGIVSPVAYYPGTKLYEDAKGIGDISDKRWFDDKAPGLFVRNDEETGRWIGRLTNELGTIRGRSWYHARDFVQHRREAAGDCWVTDILEGDYWLDQEEYVKSGSLYRSVTRQHPHNAWGYMRLGKLHFHAGNFGEAAGNFRRVSELAPAYYGGWLKYAECLIAIGDRAGAQPKISRARECNPFDPRIRDLARGSKG